MGENDSHSQNMGENDSHSQGMGENDSHSQWLQSVYAAWRIER